MNAAQRINQTSGSVEWYTPKEIIEAARSAMGCICLDPASSVNANAIVRAERIFIESENGLSRKWLGNVWMNHPFGRTTNKAWINKLIDEYHSERVTQACCITFASTSEAWFQPLYDFPLCFVSPRVNYRLPNGKIKRGVTKGSVVAGIGVNIHRFTEYFRSFGRIMLPYGDRESNGNASNELFADGTRP